MLEKRFIYLLNLYQTKMKNLKLNSNIIHKLEYIKDCLDHLENEIDNLNIETETSEDNILYKNLEKNFGPILLSYLTQFITTPH